MSVGDKVILLVEDNPVDVSITQRAFKKANILNRVVVMQDGVEALDYSFGGGVYAGRELDDQPILILLDLKLPRVDGLEVPRRIRADERTKLLPAVILTSSREEADVVAGYSLGANSYVRKPVNSEEFAEAVRQLGLYWMILNEDPPVRGG
ncbi:MAG: response regulator [Chloroflexi bacterium]|nr:response regulator [Chloroflexota bacterium]MCL5108221.1 response regulator [Chloroflexota bacterium]